MRYILDARQSRRPNLLVLALATPCGFALLSLAALRVTAKPATTWTAFGDGIGSERALGSSAATPPPVTLPAAENAAPNGIALPLANLPQPRTSDAEPVLPNRSSSALPPMESVSPQNTPPAATQNTAEENTAHTEPVVWRNAVWGKAVDGLEPGFVPQTNGATDGRAAALDATFHYRVLVRNTSRKERAFRVECQDFSGLEPYLIPDAELQKALGGDKLPNQYRAQAVSDERLAFVAYSLKLAPGEAILLPDPLHLYVGEGDKQNYPRIEQVQPGRNWIVQPIAIRPLTPQESAEDLSAIHSPYGNGIDLAIWKQDGTTGVRRGARCPIGSGGKLLYAKFACDFGSAHADNLSAEKPIHWGEVSNGIQLGARLVQESAAFKAGDVVKFQPFARNLSGQDVRLSVGNYWKVNYRIQIQTFDGKPVYMERDTHNRAELVAGYRVESLGNGAMQQVSEALLKIAPQGKPAPTELASAEPGHYIINQDEAMVESVALKPGRYRVRIVSWSLFGQHKLEPMSGWIPIEVKAN